MQQRSDGELDYEELHNYVLYVGEDGVPRRNLSATVTVQNEVIKDLIARMALLEERSVACEMAIMSLRR